MANLVDNVNINEALLGVRIAEEIHTLRHLYNTQRYRSYRSAGRDIPHMEGRVLFYVADHPGATLRDLSAHLMRDKAQIARLIAGLREIETLEARSDAQDRRVQRLHLTSKGAEMLADVRRQRTIVAERGIASLTPDERQVLLALLRKVKANLDHEEG